MKNKFNLKNIIKKIKSNKAEETINKAILIIGGLVLVALLMVILINNGKNSINETGGIIDNVLNSVDVDSSNTSEEYDAELINKCNEIKQKITILNSDYNYCNAHTFSYEERVNIFSYEVREGCFVKNYYEDATGYDSPSQSYYASYKDRLIDTINIKINNLNKEKTDLGCPL